MNLKKSRFRVRRESLSNALIFFALCIGVLFFLYLLYQQAFPHFKIGAAFAIAYILFVIIFALTLAQWKVGKSSVHYH